MDDFPSSRRSEDDREELIDSIKRLFSEPEFSDLVIATRNQQYPVHKAIVCPRSTYFAAECRDPGSETSRSGVLSLLGDEPRAIEMVLRYLYYLDYPSFSADEELDVDESPPPVENLIVNGTIPHGSCAADEPAIEILSEKSKEEPAPSELEEFLPPRKPKNKKKKRKQSQSVSELALEDKPVQEEQKESHSTSTTLDSADTATDTGPMKLENEDTQEDTAVESLPPATSLKIHVQVHALSQKYGIEGLQKLALNKFKTEAEINWASDSFLRAVKEVYSAPVLPEEETDKTQGQGISGLVTSIIYQHPELLDKAEVQKVLSDKAPRLALDVLMRVRKHGGFGF